MSEIQQRVGEINQESPVILVCATGGRSAKVAEFMASMGYKNLYNHSDGTKGWITKGYAVER
jgi:rhodanese-related sulfurtransferase